MVLLGGSVYYLLSSAGVDQGSEVYSVGREVAGRRSVDADGIATHVVGRDDEDVEALDGGVSERSYGEEYPG
jgi:hypothetical protein